jgi:hypothetical protein
MRHKNESLVPERASPRWLSPSQVAFRLGVSRSQVSRMGVKFQWRRLPVSTCPASKNAGIRYALSSIEEYEQTFSY